MNPYKVVLDDMKSLVAADATLAAALNVTNKYWMDVGIPQATGGTYPQVRFDGLVCLDDKLNRYTVLLKLYSKDLTYKFYELVEQFRAALKTSDVMFADGYVDRPETGLSCVQFLVMFSVPQ